MRRIAVVITVIVLVGAALATSASKPAPSTFQFSKEARNPVTNFRWNLEPDDFQFVIVSDRTGGHRPNVFSQAIAKLNLLQPEFILTVGDLIEGGKNIAQINKEWQEMDGFTSQLTVPFFYAAGNHDVGTKETAKTWENKLGRSYYHFLYRGVLFVMLNSDDPPEVKGAIGREQIAWLGKILDDSRQARWTIVVVHRPLWINANLDKNGWLDVEKALAGRPYTVFCGHEHAYRKFVRQGQNYYQLATTGGKSLMRGLDEGEIDHVTWVTMKKNGPLLSNLLLDSIQAEDLQKPKTDERGFAAKKLPTFPARGQAFLDGTPVSGSEIKLYPVKGGAEATGTVAADGTFTLSTYVANDGAAEGEYAVTVVSVTKVPEKKDTKRMPAKYGDPKTSGLRASIRAGLNDLAFDLVR